MRRASLVSCAGLDVARPGAARPGSWLRWCAVLAVLLVGSLSAGCAARAVPIARDLTFELRRPQALGEARYAVARVELVHGPKPLTLTVQSEVADGRVVIVGLTPFGSRVFTLRLVDERVSAETNENVPLPIAPELWLADFQLLLWPVESVRAGLGGDHPKVVDTAGPPRRRRIYRGSRLVIDIEYGTEQGAERFRYKHLERGYELEILSRPLAAEGED